MDVARQCLEHPSWADVGRGEARPRSRARVPGAERAAGGAADDWVAAKELN